MNSASDVLICGAGPTGLMLAHQLKAQKIPFLIIDKKSGPTKLSQAVGIHARSLEALDDCSLAKEFVERGVPLKEVAFFEKETKLGGVSFEQLDSQFPFLLGLPQDVTENILIDKLKEKQEQVLFDHELVELKNEKDSVQVKIKKLDGSVFERTFCFVFGCDGIHSTVRELLKIPFTGGDLNETFGLADIEFKSDIPRDLGAIYLGNKGIMLFVPLPNDRYRIIINNVTPSKTQEFSKEELEAFILDRTGKTIDVSKINWSSRFYIHYKKADSFQKDKVFLLGDAGHVHSPAGGQGMNTGLQDAYNLGWKIGFVYHNYASEELLQTYAIEREYNAKKLLSMTELLTKIMITKSAFFRAIRRFVISHILTKPKVAKKLSNKFSQLSISYHSLHSCDEKIGNPFSHAGRLFNLGPKSGSRALNGPVSDKKNTETKTLFEYMKSPEKIYILLFCGANDLNKRALEELVKSPKQNPLKGTIEYVLITKKTTQDISDQWEYAHLIDETETLHEKYGAIKPCAYIVRPDKYIAYRQPSFKHLGLQKALGALFKVY